MRKLLQFLLVGLCSFSLIACGDKSGDDGKDGGSANDNSETIKIGHFGSLTGNTATFGQETQRGLELAEGGRVRTERKRGAAGKEG